MSGRLIDAFTQFFDGAGDPLAYGWLRFLESGSNNTPKDTYNDDDLNVANANPLRLDGEGRCPSVFGEGRYRVISYYNDPNDETTTGAQIQSFDPVTAQGETTGGSGGGTFDDWDSQTEYSVGDLVTHSSKYYRSIANFNLNKNPAVEDGYWEEIEFVVYWNENVDYDIGEMVRDGGNLYFSTVANNLNNIPNDSPVEWRRVDRVFLTTDGYTVNYQVEITDRDKLLTFGSSAVASGTFTMPAVTEDNDGFIYNFYNAADYDLYLVPTVPSTLWLSDTITLKRGSYLQLQYNFEYDKWLPVNNSGPALGGQDIGTLTSPILEMFVNTLHFVGNFDIELATTSMWRFHTDGTFYPLSTNPLQNIGTIADPVNDFWLDGYIYFTDAENWIHENSGSLQITAKTSLSLATYADPERYVTLSSTGLLVRTPLNVTGSATFDSVLSISGNTYPAVDNSYNLGIANTNEWANIYLGTGRLSLHDQSAYLQHNGATLILSNSVGNTYFDNPSGGDWYFREGGVVRYQFNDTGVLEIVGNGTTSSFNLSLGSSAQGKIFQNSAELVLYTSGDIDFYAGNTLHWTIYTSGHFYPRTAGVYDIGGTSNEIRDFFMSGVMYLGSTQGASINWDASFGLTFADYSLRFYDLSNTDWIQLTGFSFVSNSKISFSFYGSNGQTYQLTNYVLYT